MKRIALPAAGVVLGLLIGVVLGLLIGRGGADPDDGVRHSPLYLDCLTRGHAEAACERAVRAKIELTRIEAAKEEKACREEMAKKYPNDPFAADFKC